MTHRCLPTHNSAAPKAATDKPTPSFRRREWTAPDHAEGHLSQLHPHRHSLSRLTVGPPALRHPHRLPVTPLLRVASATLLAPTSPSIYREAHPTSSDVIQGVWEKGAWIHEKEHLYVWRPANTPSPSPEDTWHWDALSKTMYKGASSETKYTRDQVMASHLRTFSAEITAKVKEAREKAEEPKQNQAIADAIQETVKQWEDNAPPGLTPRFIDDPMVATSLMDAVAEGHRLGIPANATDLVKRWFRHPKVVDARSLPTPEAHAEAIESWVETTNESWRLRHYTTKHRRIETGSRDSPGWEARPPTWKTPRSTLGLTFGQKGESKTGGHTNPVDWAFGNIGHTFYALVIPPNVMSKQAFLYGSLYYKEYKWGEQSTVWISGDWIDTPKELQKAENQEALGEALKHTSGPRGTPKEVLRYLAITAIAGHALEDVSPETISKAVAEDLSTTKLLEVKVPGQPTGEAAWTINKQYNGKTQWVDWNQLKEKEGKRLEFHGAVSIRPSERMKALSGSEGLGTVPTAKVKGE